MLNNYNELNDLQLWMHEMGILRLWDICSWDLSDEGECKPWTILDLPSHLVLAYECLKARLQGKDPLNKFSKGKRGWGTKSGEYSIAKGYKVLSHYQSSSTNEVV